MLRSLPGYRKTVALVLAIAIVDIGEIWMFRSTVYTGWGKRNFIWLI